MVILETEIDTLEGTVKWFNAEKGYGFITCKQQDYFVHFKSIIGDGGYRKLDDNMKVKFKPFQGKRGYEAHDVRVIK